MSTSEKINILVAADDNYAKYCAVMLTSLLENNKDENIDVYLMSAGLNEQNEKILRNIVEIKYNQRLIIAIINQAYFRDFPLRKCDHISIATYFRLICTDVLPKTLNKILYLDCDIIVRDSIRELWNYNIDEYGLAATLDPCWTQGNKYERLELNPDNGYFCAGVMLINLKTWKTSNVKERSIEILKKMKDNLLLHDQDILNIIFAKKWKSISFRWDYCCLDDLSFGSEEEFVNDLNKKSKYYPVIIHFAGVKPWGKRGYYLYQCEFDYYYYIALGYKNFAKYNWTSKYKRLYRKIINKTNWKDKYL